MVDGRSLADRRRLVASHGGILVAGESRDLCPCPAQFVSRSQRRLDLLGEAATIDVQLPAPLDQLAEAVSDAFAIRLSPPRSVVHRRIFSRTTPRFRAACRSCQEEQVNDGTVVVANGILTHVHDPALCVGRPYGCWIHRPLAHPLSDAPVVWREDKGTAERVCPHGVGHPDPQDAAYHLHAVGRDVSVHRCDGCCGPTPEWAR